MHSAVHKTNSRKLLVLGILVAAAAIAYLFVDVSGLYGKAYEGQKIESAADFASILLEKKYVAVVPCADFGMPDYIRLSYATSMELIKKGMDRIEEMVKELK